MESKIEKINNIERYVHQVTDSELISLPYIKGVMKQLDIVETELNKDILQFNQDEMQYLLNSFNYTSHFSLKSSVSRLNTYIRCTSRWNNTIPNTEITGDMVKKAIRETESKLMTRTDMYKIASEMLNYVDRAIIVLLYEGVMGTGFNELLNLEWQNANLETGEIELDNRIVKLSPPSIEILKRAKEECQYTKNGSLDYTGKHFYNFNMSSPYVIRNKPTTFNNNGLYPLKLNSIKCRLTKLLVDFDTTAMDIYTSGIVEKVVMKEIDTDTTLSIMKTKSYIKNELKLKAQEERVYNAVKELREKIKAELVSEELC